MAKTLLRRIPSVDSLLQSEEGQALTNDFPRQRVVQELREVLASLRQDIIAKKFNEDSAQDMSAALILQEVRTRVHEKFRTSLQEALNATGVILHTGLGRALLPKRARQNIASIIEGYCSLAVDVSTGRRGHRDVHLDALLCELTGAEAATVVNNNAAATMLILNTLANGKEVIISRGQLVEIGGSFRMPDVMAASGAVMKEVGTTNKTHLRDYAEAIGDNTGAIMRVHHSNYRIVGFAQEPSLEELASLAKDYHLPLIDDLGSGALVDLREYGLEPEPLVQDSMKVGADVACFSGDKLVGGPQSGIIVGKVNIIARLRKNPMMRAFRVGKMTIAGLEAALRLFLKPDRLKIHHPVYRMLAMDQAEIGRRARRVMKRVQAQAPGSVDMEITAGGSQVGSGSVPVEILPTKLLAMRPTAGTAESLARRLRQQIPPLFARVQKESVLLDFRTIQPDQDRLVLKILLDCLRPDDV